MERSVVPSCPPHPVTLDNCSPLVFLSATGVRGKSCDRKYSEGSWHSCLIAVNSIIKIEWIVNAGAVRYYEAMAKLFIEVFGVIYWRLLNM